LLLDSENNVKLADFGMCGIDVRDTLFNTSCGSPHYASPEVIEGVPYDGTKADIWSCGVILYALVAGKLPFDDNDLVTVLEKVKEGVYETPACIPADIQDLISKILVVNPGERFTIEQIREHAWYKENIGTSATVIENKIEKTATKPISPEYIGDYMKTISDIGLGEVADIENDLGSDEASIIKTYYGILEDRAKNKRPVLTEKSKSKLSRAKSEAMLPLSKVSKTFRTSSNQLGNSISRAREGKRVGSMNADALIKIESEPKDSSPSNSPLRTSSKDAKRARFLPSWFGSSDSHLKKEKGSKDIIESTKSLSEITTELEETLDSMDSTYSFSRKRDKIKAKITRESKNVRFAVHIGKAAGYSESAPIYVISFSRRGGSDKDVYNQVCDNIKRLLDI